MSELIIRINMMDTITKKWREPRLLADGSLLSLAGVTAKESLGAALYDNMTFRAFSLVYPENIWSCPQKARISKHNMMETPGK